MVTARLIGKLGGGVKWVPSGITGPNAASYKTVVISPDGKFTVVEIESRAGGASTYIIDPGDTTYSLSNGLHYIALNPGQRLYVNSRSTAVRYAFIEP